MTVKWRRETTRYGTHYCVYIDGEKVICVGKVQHCGYWYCWYGVEQEDADGTRFNFLWEAKQYAERQLEKGRPYK